VKRTSGLLAVVMAFALAGCGSTSTTSASDTAATLSPAPAVSRPTRVHIPVLRVDSNVIDLGLQPDGTMQVPPDAKDTGWYTSSPTPGATGPAVLAAHVNWKGVDGPFAHLERLKAGDVVTVEHDDGSTSTFAVSRVETFAKDAFPTDTVYGDVSGPELRLITCGGAFDTAAHSYESNTIAFARIAT
jgi:hypothetical protein